MAFLVGLLRFLVLLFVVRLALRALAAFLRGRSAPAAAPAAAPGGELVRDRVCNTFLPRERALLARVNGQEEHFCSPECRDKALGAVPRAC